MYQAKSGVKNFSLYWGGGGGGPSAENFFPVWTCIKPNLVSKIFPFTGWGGGSLCGNFFFPVWTCIKPNLVSKIFPFTGWGGPSAENFFFQSEHVSSQIWCQKFFPLLGGGGPSAENFFSSLNMYQAKSGVKNFSLYWVGGGVPLWKIFFPSLNMYQAKSGVKNFSLYWVGGGGSLCGNFFSQSEHVSSQIWCQKFFPLLGWGGSPLWKNFFPSLNMYQAKSGVKNFSLYWDPPWTWDWVPPLDLRPGNPPLDLRLGTPLDLRLDPPPDLRPGTPPGPEARYPPPVQGWIGLPPPQKKVNRQTFPSINITFPRTTYAGGNNAQMVYSQETVRHIYFCVAPVERIEITSQSTLMLASLRAGLVLIICIERTQHHVVVSAWKKRVCSFMVIDKIHVKLLFIDSFHQFVKARCVSGSCHRAFCRNVALWNKVIPP